MIWFKIEDPNNGNKWEKDTIKTLLEYSEILDDEEITEIYSSKVFGEYLKNPSRHSNQYTKNHNCVNSPDTYLVKARETIVIFTFADDDPISPTGDALTEDSKIMLFDFYEQPEDKPIDSTEFFWAQSIILDFIKDAYAETNKPPVVIQEP